MLRVRGHAMRIDVEVLVSGRRGRTLIATIERKPNEAPTQGMRLRLDEVKALIGRLQQMVAAEHAGEVVAALSQCAECKRQLSRKGSAPIIYRTAFGKLQLESVRLYSICECGHRAHGSASVNPLAIALTERSHPELVYLQTRWRSVQELPRTSR
jgi:hypothetical protein